MYMYIRCMALRKTILCLEFLLSINWNVYSRQCAGSFRCCFGYKWNDTIRSCIRCDVGYTGVDCSAPCPYPYYGEHCQQMCHCSNDKCNTVFGCVSGDIPSEETTPGDVNSVLPTNMSVSGLRHLGMTNDKFQVETIPENITLRVNLSGNFSEIPESRSIPFTTVILFCVLLSVLVILMMAISCVYKTLKGRKSNGGSLHYTETPLKSDLHLYSKLKMKD